MKTAGLLLVACLTLAGCGSADDSAVGGVSPTEAKALNDAAAMLDEQAANSAFTAAESSGAEAGAAGS